MIAILLALFLIVGVSHLLFSPPSHVPVMIGQHETVVYINIRIVSSIMASPNLLTPESGRGLVVHKVVT